MRSTSIFSTSLLAALPLTAQAASGSGKSTRYWDCCKPSCSWPGKAAVSQPVFACDANFNRISDPNARSGCDGGPAYSCADHTPFAINDDLAYGFAATAISGGSEASWCCACYALTFNSGPVAGKTMIVQSTSTGGDLGNNHFDLAMPGGGVGLFNGCNSQFGGIPGATYGGISDRSECASLPDALKPGCQFRFDWFKNADNPTFTFKQVQCPAELVARTGCKRPDDGDFPAFSPPSGSGSKGGVSNGSGNSNGGNAQPTSTKPSVASPTSTKPIVAKPTSTKPSVANPASTKPSSPSPSPNDSCGATPPTSCAAPKYAQCGGNGFTGCTTCEAGSTCTFSNDWYSQCI